MKPEIKNVKSFAYFVISETDCEVKRANGFRQSRSHGNAKHIGTTRYI